MSNSKKKGKIIKWIILAILLLLAVVGFILSRTMKQQSTPVGTYTSGTVKQQDLAKYVNMSGTITGKDSVTITGNPSLKVTELNVKIGDKVKKGDVLFGSLKVYSGSDTPSSTDVPGIRIQTDAGSLVALNQTTEPYDVDGILVLPLVGACRDTLAVGVHQPSISSFWGKPIRYCVSPSFSRQQPT